MFLTYFALSFVCCLAADSVLLTDRSIGGIRTTSVLVDTPLTIDSVEKIYRRLKARLPNVVSTVRVFRDRGGAAKILTGKGSTDLDRSDWLASYTTLSIQPSIEMGEVIQAGDDTIIRVSSNNRVANRIIEGTNPLLCSTEKVKCEVLWVSIGKIPTLYEHFTDRPRVNLFVRIDSLPELSSAKLIAGQLHQRFKTPLLSVIFRKDDLFPDSSEFPVIYPFRGLWMIAAPKEIKLDDEVSCLALEDSFVCRRSGSSW